MHGEGCSVWRGREEGGWREGDDAWGGRVAVAGAWREGDIEVTGLGKKGGRGRLGKKRGNGK